MTPEQEQMLAKVERFAFDPPDAVLTFVKRFAREHKVSEDFAARAADEYLKFMFLCAISETELTPSHTVDLVWHLHMTYTENYWVGLCQNTLGKRIHHKPTTGGKANANRFRQQYLATLSAYKDVFGKLPPDDIWEPADVRFSRRHVAVDQQQYWVIRKPTIASGRRSTRKRSRGRTQVAGRGRNRRWKKSDDLFMNVVLVFMMLSSAALLVFAITMQNIPIAMYGGLTFLLAFVLWKAGSSNNATNRAESTGKGNEGSTGCGTGFLAGSDDAAGGDGDSGCGGDGCGGCGGCGGGCGGAD